MRKERKKKLKFSFNKSLQLCQCLQYVILLMFGHSYTEYTDHAILSFCVTRSFRTFGKLPLRTSAAFKWMNQTCSPGKGILFR